MTTHGSWISANGTRSDTPLGCHGFHIQMLETGESVFPGDEVLYNIDSLCIELHDAFRDRVFGNPASYYDGLPLLPIWVREAGHVSDPGWEREDFVDLLSKNMKAGSDGPAVNLSKHLFLADLQSLVSSLQNRVLETHCDLVGFFGELADLDPAACTHSALKDDAVYCLSGARAVGSIFSAMTSGIVKLYSLLDIITKISVEWHNLPSDLSQYPRLKSRGILYGKAGSAELVPLKNTLPEIRRLINLRNELIHEGGWEPSPTVFCRSEGGRVVERWILLPDTSQEGTLHTFRNRKRFYGLEHRANSFLPNMFIAVWNGLHDSLEGLLRGAPQDQTCAVK